MDKKKNFYAKWIAEHPEKAIMNRNEDITNEQQPSSRPTLPGWLFRLMMFREKTKVKGKTKAKHLEVSGKLRTFAFGIVYKIKFLK